MTDWVEITKRNARSVQTTIGWIYWDPGAVSRLESLGLNGPLGYIAARAAPLGPAGPEAVVAAFGSISPMGIAIALDVVEQKTTFDAVWAARDEAVLEGLARHAAGIMEPLARFGPALWAVVDRLPRLGRVFFGAHLRMPRPADPVLSGWHAINCLREWRGDTHWAIIAAADLTGTEASIVHNAWIGYDKDWLAESRGSSAEEIRAGWAQLESRGLVTDGEVNAAGLELRQHIEDETDRLTTTPWTLLGEADSIRFADELEPPCENLLARVDLTAGVNYQPASRIR
jgi:Helix-turn-helix family